MKTLKALFTRLVIWLNWPQERLEVVEFKTDELCGVLNDMRINLHNHLFPKTDDPLMLRIAELERIVKETNAMEVVRSRDLSKRLVDVKLMQLELKTSGKVTKMSANARRRSRKWLKVKS